MQMCMIFHTAYLNIILFVMVEHACFIQSLCSMSFFFFAVICQSFISFCLVVAFQGKPYLWGVFKPRKDKMRRLPPVEQDCTAHVSKEEHAQEQHALDQEDKAQSDTLDQVVHPENQPFLDANQPGKEALSGNGLPPVDVQALVSANIGPADHGQPCSNPEAPPLKLCGFVVSRTPRSAQLIEEMQKEGALLFAVQQVMTEPGSVM